MAQTRAKRTPYLSMRQAAELHGCSERTIRRMIALGELPAYRLGRRRIGIKAEDLDRLAVRIPAGGYAAAEPTRGSV